MVAPLHPEAELDPSQTLALLEEQRRATEQALDVDARLLPGGFLLAAAWSTLRSRP